jgi:ketosteroid isomerase-like protein
MYFQPRLIILSAIFIAGPAFAADPAHKHKADIPPASASHSAMDHAKTSGHMKNESGAGQTIKAYRDALVRQDASVMPALFAKDSQIFENGKSEGSFSNYLEHHLGPELGHFESFTFTNPTLTITERGDTALAIETYGYVIVLKDGRRIERTGVATSVLIREDGAWKILRYHSSSRTPKKPK